MVQNIDHQRRQLHNRVCDLPQKRTGGNRTPVLTRNINRHITMEVARSKVEHTSGCPIIVNRRACKTVICHFNKILQHLTSWASLKKERKKDFEYIFQNIAESINFEHYIKHNITLNRQAYTPTMEGYIIFIETEIWAIFISARKWVPETPYKQGYAF